ncbi:MAG: YibE/F family protein [Anaerolineales bacterium]
MNNKILRWFLFCVLAATVLYFLWPYFFEVEIPDAGFSSFGSETARARVIAIVEEGNVELGARTQNYQIASVEILEGDHQGLVAEIDFGRRQLRSDEYRLAPGDLILVTVSETPDAGVNVYFSDFVRSTPLLILVLAFALAILVISRWKGLRSLLSLAFSLLVIIGYIIPHILAGEDALLVSIIGSAICSASCFTSPMAGVSKRTPPCSAWFHRCCSLASSPASL